VPRVVSREAALQETDAACHRREVNALVGGAVLDVVDVTGQRVVEKFHRCCLGARASTQAWATALSVKP
jgi:hypothetical protein